MEVMSDMQPSLHGREYFGVMRSFHASIDADQMGNLYDAKAETLSIFHFDLKIKFVCN